MKILIIYDSYFGNTEKVAREIANIFEVDDDVIMIRASDFAVEHLNKIDLLVIGSPTRVFSPSPNIKKFLRKIPKNGLKGIKVTSFDTRMSLNDVRSGLLKFLVKLFGYAAESTAKQMVKKGGNIILKPIGFLVKDTEGPLYPGELIKASKWVKNLI